jgi:hypothetical protein
LEHVLKSGNRTDTNLPVIGFDGSSISCHFWAKLETLRDVFEGMLGQPIWKEWFSS